MFQNQLKITFRRLLKDKSTTFIHLAGLSIGLTAAFFIGLYVLNEWKTDRFLPHPERTFRLLRVNMNNKDEPYRIGITSPPYAAALKQDFPDDVEEIVRLQPGNSLVQLGERRFREENYYYADAHFFRFFNLPMLHGDPVTALAKPNQVVLTRATARRYFGSEEEAMGKTLRIDNRYEALVTGVAADLPAPAHFDFDIVENIRALEHQEWWNDWWSNGLCTYLRLPPGVDVAHFQGKLTGFMDKYFGKDFAETGHIIQLELEPIRSVYFNAGTLYDPMRHGNRQAVNVFLLAAILLVVVACANYVNLSTAKASERSREIGVRKVLGSGRGNIAWQMVSESVLLAAVGVVLAAQLSALAMPWFEEVFGVNYSYRMPVWMYAGAMLGVTALVGCLAGVYPGWMLSAFKPIVVLKGGDRSGTGSSGSSRLRKALVVGQFAFSVALLCSTAIIREQLDFLQSKSLGFDKEHVLLLDAGNEDIYEKRATLRQRLLQSPDIQSVSFSDGHPGGYHDGTNVKIQGWEKEAVLRTTFCDFDYPKTMGLQLAAGRDFDPRLTSDSNSVVLLNERAVRDLGMTPEQALGKKLTLTLFDSIPRTIVGVVKDYHFRSLRDDIEPLVICNAFWGGQLLVKVKAGQLESAMASLEKNWGELAPAYPFEYRFLDETLRQLYQDEERQSRVFGLFAIIAIFIACLGMLGLTAFAASSRVKEIGIRKVLGATTAGIVALLSKDFLKLVVVALVIASPLAYFFMEKWLQDFAYRIDIPWTVFALAGVVAVAVAFLTVSFQSVKAAVANPVKALRSE